MPPLSYNDFPSDIKNGNNIQENVANSKRKNGGLVYFAGIVAAMNMSGMGLAAAYTSSTTPSMMHSSNNVKITMEEITWIASLTQLAAIPGGSLSGYLSKKYGRKAVLMYNSIPFMASWLMVAYGNTIPWIYAGRFLTGFCCGVATVNVAAYLVEISTPSNRGRLSSLFNFLVSIGAFIAVGLGIIISWRWVAATGAIFITFNMFLLCFIPESPHWLIANGYKNEAIQALKFLRGNWETANLDYDKISNSLQNQETNLSLSEFAKPFIYKPIFISMALIFFQQFCGINPLMAYTVEIFSQAGGLLAPDSAALVVGVLQMVATSFSSVVIDKLGRRTYFMLSGTFLSCGLIILSLFIHYSTNDKEFSSKFGWMPILGYAIFLLAYAVGYGPIPFTQAAEMSPLYARSAIVAIATVCMYFFSFIVTKTFNNFEQVLGNYGVFALYAGICMLGVIFAWFFQPETKGKPLAEIEKSFVQKKLKNYKDLP